MSGYGILGCGAYVPLLRLPRARIAEAHGWLNPARAAGVRGERSVAAWDEDALTMAVEAARDSLRDLVAQVGIDRVQLVSTTPPFADRSNSGLLAAALDLPETVVATDAGGSLRAATAALRQLAADRAPTTLLTASDRRLARPGGGAELAYGDGAAALVVGPGEPLAEILGSAGLTRDLVDHYRATGEDFDYAFEERWVRDEGWFALVPDTARAALDAAGITAGDIDRFICPAPARVAKKLAKLIGLDDAAPADPLLDTPGHTGVAHPLLQLCAALEQATPGQRLLLVGFGQGADALVLRTTDRIGKPSARTGVAGHLARRREEHHYMRFLSFQGLVDIDWGMRAEHDRRTAQSAHYRKRDAINAFVGGRCSACGTCQFPASHVCVHCGAVDTQAPHRFADSRARVKTFTEDWQAHSPAPPLMYGSVSFEEGGSVMMEYADFAPGELAVGLALRMAFRIKDIDERRGFRRYFWKPVAAEPPQEAR